MDRCDERDDGLSCTHISLQEPCHSIRLSHILEDLEEDDFLLVGESEGKSRDDLLDEICIEWDRGCESCRLSLCCLLLLHTDELELEEFTVSELMLRSIKGFYRSREVDIANIRAFCSDSFLRAYYLRDIIIDIVEKWLHIGHLLPYP